MDVNVFFDAYQSANPLFDMMLVHFGRLDDDDTALHLSLDHIDLGIASASQRCQSVKHVFLYDTVQSPRHFSLQKEASRRTLFVLRPLCRDCGR